jgi:hypothetical protein
MESGDHLPTLPKIAEALDLEILVKMSPPDRERGAEGEDGDEARVVERISMPRGASPFAELPRSEASIARRAESG